MDAKAILEWFTWALRQHGKESSVVQADTAGKGKSMTIKQRTDSQDTEPSDYKRQKSKRN